MAANGITFIQDYEREKRQRDLNLDRWERMAPFIAPSRGGMLTPQAIGQSMMRGVFDSTSMMAAELMAMFVAGHIMNPGQLWYGWELPGTGDQTAEWLEECRDISNRNLLASLFYAEAPESMIDWCGFGTGCLFGDEAAQPINRTIKGFRGFHWRAEKTGRFVLVEGPDGKPESIYREFMQSAQAAYDFFVTSKQGTIPENIQAAIDNGQKDRKFKFVHGIYPRRRSEQGEGYGAKGMAWASCWVEYESKHVCFESGYRRLPAAVFRYQKIGDDPYGRGRGDIAFPDTWTLNSAKRMGFEDWALKIRPPVLHGHNSVMGGTFRLTPGGPTPINTHGKSIRDSVMPFETGSHPEVSQINEENLRMTIRQIYYIDHILKLLETEKSEMTKYEFAKKIALLFKLIAPIYGRTNSELLYSVSDLTWDLQFNAGAFPPPPPEVQNTDGNINVVFHNPIARAQRRDDAEALMIAVNDVAPMVNLHPEVLDRLDLDEAFSDILDIDGVPARWRKSDDELAKLRQAKFQQNQQQNQLDTMEQVATAAGKVAPAMEKLGMSRASAGASNVGTARA